MRERPHLVLKGLRDRAPSLFRSTEEALAFCRRAGYRPRLAWTCCDYADCLREGDSEGDRENAVALLDESLQISRASWACGPSWSGFCPGGRYWTTKKGGAFSRFLQTFFVTDRNRPGSLCGPAYQAIRVDSLGPSAYILAIRMSSPCQ